jgi:hypothetical protein
MQSEGRMIHLFWRFLQVSPPPEVLTFLKIWGDYLEFDPDLSRGDYFSYLEGDGLDRWHENGEIPTSQGLVATSGSRYFQQVLAEDVYHVCRLTAPSPDSLTSQFVLSTSSWGDFSGGVRVVTIDWVSKTLTDPVYGSYDFEADYVIIKCDFVTDTIAYVLDGDDYVGCTFGSWTIAQFIYNQVSGDRVSNGGVPLLYELGDALPFTKTLPHLGMYRIFYSYVLRLFPDYTQSVDSYIDKEIMEVPQILWLEGENKDGVFGEQAEEGTIISWSESVIYARKFSQLYAGSFHDVYIYTYRLNYSDTLGEGSAFRITEAWNFNPHTGAVINSPAILESRLRNDFQIHFQSNWNSQVVPHMVSIDCPSCGYSIPEYGYCPFCGTYIGIDSQEGFVRHWGETYEQDFFGKYPTWKYSPTLAGHWIDISPSLIETFFSQPLT